MTLAGKGAVVTGGGRGIGSAVARALAAAGAPVVVAARTLAEVREVAGRLRAQGRPAWGVRCDVSRPASVRALARAAARHLGRVDILVNSAGIAPSAPLHRLTLAEWNRVMAVNATGTFLCTRAFLPAMAARRWGRVVNIASTAALTAGPYLAAYAASKHAVMGFTRAAAAEAAARGVTVNAVCPGYVDTALTGRSLGTIAARTGMSPRRALAILRNRSPQRRLMEPEEVAYLVLALCDPRAGGINGQAVVLDGGGLLS